MDVSTVVRWRDRFAREGMAGLDDRPRSGRPPVYGPEVRLRIVATATSTPHRLIAEHLADTGVSASQVGRSTTHGSGDHCPSRARACQPQAGTLCSFSRSGRSKDWTRWPEGTVSLMWLVDRRCPPVPVLVARVPEDHSAVARRLQEDGYAPLPGLLTPYGLGTLREEARRLEKAARRRDFAMACMSDSPRHMTTLGGHDIARESVLIPACTATRPSWTSWPASRGSGPSPSPTHWNAMC